MATIEEAVKTWASTGTEGLNQLFIRNGITSRGPKTTTAEELSEYEASLSNQAKAPYALYAIGRAFNRNPKTKANIPGLQPVATWWYTTCRVLPPLLHLNRPLLQLLTAPLDYKEIVALLAHVRAGEQKQPGELQRTPPPLPTGIERLLSGSSSRPTKSSARRRTRSPARAWSPERTKIPELARSPARASPARARSPARASPPAEEEEPKHEALFREWKQAVETRQITDRSKTTYIKAINELYQLVTDAIKRNFAHKPPYMLWQHMLKSPIAFTPPMLEIIKTYPALVLFSSAPRTLLSVWNIGKACKHFREVFQCMKTDTFFEPEDRAKYTESIQKIEKVLKSSVKSQHTEFVVDDDVIEFEPGHEPKSDTEEEEEEESDFTSESETTEEDESIEHTMEATLNSTDEDYEEDEEDDEDF